MTAHEFIQLTGQNRSQPGLFVPTMGNCSLVHLRQILAVLFGQPYRTAFSFFEDFDDKMNQNPPTFENDWTMASKIY